MSDVRGVLNVTDEGRHIGFLCPGCEEPHFVRVGVPDRPCWGFNGDFERPTFSPSILVTSGHHVQGWKPGDGCWCGTEDAAFGCSVCHSFVEAGQIRFLSDCTHALAGQTVPLPPFAWRTA